MNVSIIIPNYNGESLLRKNLPRILAAAEGYKQGTVELIIVDDKSMDESMEVIKTFKEDNKHSHVSLLEHKHNMGFSSAVNTGVKNAKGEIVILLNTDVIPEKGFIDKAIKHFTDGNVFAVGFMDKSIEDEKIILRGRGVGSWKRGFLIHRKGNVEKTNSLWASGGSSAFRKSVWDNLGSMHEIYNPFYWEDIDLSYRALKAGYKVDFDKDIIVVHEHEKGAIRSLFSQDDVKVIAYRNQFYFVWINADVQMLVKHAIWLPYHMAKALLRLDGAFFGGFLQASRNCANVLNYRRKVQKLFTKSDTIIDEYLS